MTRSQWTKKRTEDKDSNQNSEGETEEGSISNTDWNQDSEVFFIDDTDEDIEMAEIEEED